jgi:hypothetical protein
LSRRQVGLRQLSHAESQTTQRAGDIHGSSDPGCETGGTLS